MGSTRTILKKNNYDKIKIFLKREQTEQTDMFLTALRKKSFIQSCYFTAEISIDD